MACRESGPFRSKSYWQGFPCSRSSLCAALEASWRGSVECGNSYQALLWLADSKTIQDNKAHDDSGMNRKRMLNYT